MRIAILAHVRQPISEPFMGGMEAHSWHLASGLVARGHDVVLFASGDSDPRFAIDAVLAEGYDRTFPWSEGRDGATVAAHIDAGYAASCERIATGGFDVVHNNSLHHTPLLPNVTRRVPTVTSLHVPPFDALHGYVVQSPTPTHRLTVTSRTQRQAWWPDGAPPEVSVLYNGIDPDAWPFRASGDGSAVWCSRITPEKGTHLAIEAARIAGIALTLFGAIEEPGYWEDRVKPLLGGPIRYGGHLDTASLAREVGRASVFLFTPCWDEPFGLVAVEAMACGLPVASTPMGAAREVIGEAGAFAETLDGPGLARAIKAAMSIPRRVPRDRVVRLFTESVWLDRCEELYGQVRSAKR